MTEYKGTCLFELPLKVGPKNLTLGAHHTGSGDFFVIGVDFLIIILPSYGQEIFEVLRF